MRIGELARHAGVKVETVRYYEQAGVLPVPQRTPAGYREFGTEHLAVLAFVRRCRSLDMTLAEIVELLQLRERPDASCNMVNKMLDRHIEQVTARIRELRDLKAQLRALRLQCHEGLDSEHCGILGALTASKERQ